jgi:hypothetical protein
MAKKVIIVDDIDGTEGDGIVTHRFSLGSDFYEIDLCPQNLLSLRAALEPFVSAGRRVRSGNRHKPEPAPHQQDNSASDFPSQQPLTAVPHQQDNPASDFPSQQPLTAVPRQQDNPALDFPSQQPLTAVPRQQGNPALDFPREQRLVIRKWARDNGYDVGDRGAFSREVLAAYREAAEEDEQAQ